MSISVTYTANLEWAVLLLFVVVRDL